MLIPLCSKQNPNTVMFKCSAYQMCDMDVNGPICLKPHGISGDPDVFITSFNTNMVLNVRTRYSPTYVTVKFNFGINSRQKYWTLHKLPKSLNPKGKAWYLTLKVDHEMDPRLRQNDYIFFVRNLALVSLQYNPELPLTSTYR